jgi:hypothetical protein
MMHQPARHTRGSAVGALAGNPIAAMRGLTGIAEGF